MRIINSRLIGKDEATGTAKVSLMVKVVKFLKEGGHVMKNLFMIAVALFNIYNNMMVVKNLTGFCGGEQGAVNGSISRYRSFCLMLAA